MFKTKITQHVFSIYQLIRQSQDQEHALYCRDLSPSLPLSLSLVFPKFCHVLRSALSNLVAIPHMWRQRLLMWRQAQ